MRLVSRTAAAWVGLAIVAMLVALTRASVSHSVQAAEPALELARVLLAGAQSYTIRSTIDQQLTPLARANLVGQGDLRFGLEVDGTVVPGGTSRYSFRRAGAAGEPVTLVEERGRLYVEQRGAHPPVGGSAGALPTFQRRAQRELGARD